MHASDLPLHYNAAEILDRNLARFPDHVALVSMERSMTFREVAEEANQVGNALKKLRVRLGDCVAILAPDGPAWATTFFGSLKIGAVALGLNTLLREHEIGFMLVDGRARVLVVHLDLLPLIARCRSQSPFLEQIVVIGDAPRDNPSFAEWIGGESTHLDPAPTHREDFGTLNYSSGTTGDPKGVLHAHKDYALAAELVGVRVLGLQAADRTFSNAKLFFVYGLGGNLVFPWYVGASTVLHPGPSRDTRRVLEVIDRFKPTVFYNAPTGYAAALAVSDLTEAYDLSCLRLCVSAGEALPAPLWQEWKARTGIDILDGIGSTENFHMFISNRPGAIRPGSSGTPVPGYDTKIVDDAGNAVAPGKVGNLLIKGETTALGYLHQYTRSRMTFLGEWLHTGDKYSVDDDGFYWHAGRADDMLKVGGLWVSPVEVESALISHPAVSECAVVGLPDRSGLIKPKAWVKLADGYAASEELVDALIDHCTEKMAAYKRPRWIAFVDDLPKTATGKIQRFRLREWDAADPGA